MTSGVQFACHYVPDNSDVLNSTPMVINSGSGGGSGGSAGNAESAANDESTCAPVYIQSGIKHFTDVDYASSDEFGLNLVRNYSSSPVPVFVRSDRRGILARHGPVILMNGSK